MIYGHYNFDLVKFLVLCSLELHVVKVGHVSYFLGNVDIPCQL